MEMATNFSKHEGEICKKEQTSWTSRVVVLLYLPVKRIGVVDEHEHSPARMRYTKFVHYVQNYRQIPHRCCCLLAAKIPRL